MDKAAKNDPAAAVPKFCLALEEHRRTNDGRVRTSQEMLATFFTHDDKACSDRICSSTCRRRARSDHCRVGYSGVKAALRDNDEQDPAASSSTHSSPATSITWPSRTASPPNDHSLGPARRLVGILARWQAHEASPSQGPRNRIRTLSLRRPLVPRDDQARERRAQGHRRPRRRLDERRSHAVGPKDPRDRRRLAQGPGVSLGWDKIVAKTANDVLVAVLDAMVAKVGLVARQSPTARRARLDRPKHGPSPKADAAKGESMAEPPRPRSSGAARLRRPRRPRARRRGRVRQIAWLPPPADPASAGRRHRHGLRRRRRDHRARAARGAPFPPPLPRTTRTSRCHRRRAAH